MKTSTPKELKIEENVSFATLTTFKVGGPAKFFLEAETKKELEKAFVFADCHHLPVQIIGGGSNILARDEGFQGLAIKVVLKGIDSKNMGDFVEVESGAGEEWDGLVNFCVSRDLWGMENLSGIPGFVGASVVQNIGAYGTEIKDIISYAEVFDPETKKYKKMAKDDLHLGYRSSIFKKDTHKNLVVTKVCFRLSKKGKPNLRYKDLKNVFSGKPRPGLREIRDAVLRVRAKKFPDLNTHGTAGSYFKNAVVDLDVYEKLKQKRDDVAAFDYEGKKKISTAWLIDKMCEMKGVKEGNVGLFPNQPLVLVNYGNASTKEILRFAESVKKKIYDSTGIAIEEEVVVI